MADASFCCVHCHRVMQYQIVAVRKVPLLAGAGAAAIEVAAALLTVTSLVPMSGMEQAV